ncbi:MAG: YraN family protein [Slackia faecicanis]|nr:YraN family protein [Slackia faecicanis]
MEREENRRAATKERIARQAGAGGSAMPQDPPRDAEAATEEVERPREDDTASLTPHELGVRGEEAACAFLVRRGYDILERNWTCPAGEADIVAKDEDGTMVFVEVKTRSSLEAGFPSEAVTPQKRARYERIAGYFLSQYEGVECRVRFDVISILVLGNSRALIRHYVNAFASGR